MAFTLPGCGSAPEPAVVASADAPDVVLEMPAPGAPLGIEELRSFIAAVKYLPGGQVPAFESADIPHLPDIPDVADAAGRYQLALRAALDPKFQAMAWSHDPPLRAAFQKMGISPEVFAAVTLRISCAWSARTMAEDASPAQIRRNLNKRIRASIAQLERSYSEMSVWDRRQTLDSLEEMIALGEFLWLWEQVPPESIDLVARFRNELQPVLPSATLARSSSMETSRSPVRQASHETLGR
jgi:hypothetical protein